MGPIAWSHPVGPEVATGPDPLGGCGAGPVAATGANRAGVRDGGEPWSASDRSTDDARRRSGVDDAGPKPVVQAAAFSTPAKVSGTGYSPSTKCRTAACWASTTWIDPASSMASFDDSVGITLR